MLLWGINPVLEALRARRVSEIRVSSERLDGRLREIVDMAQAAHVSVRRAAPRELDRLARGGVHQGVVADVRGAAPQTLADLLAAAKTPALFVVLDGVEDPHNVGAILRSADAAGADGVIRQS